MMGKGKKFICIHGHFYQPPRENPWTGIVDRQESARPFHDWNERVTAECYKPNAAADLLDGAGKVRRILNNYSMMSFNFGPTLLSWMERERPEVYNAVIQADAESRGRFSGHGSAIAQAYNHVIMPLASPADKRTQVIWGARDFRHRFGREPEGMWLPETGVDIETLDIMAGEGLLFTILAPRQALRVREEGGDWKDVQGERIDPAVPYWCHLPSGRKIAIFFYNGEFAHDIAFGDLLRDGANFARKMISGASGTGTGARLSHAAADGETFGHHHRFGEMALAYCLETIDNSPDADLAVYGEFLEKFPPKHEVEIAGNTSWSCSHGVERWRSDCGCTAGGHPDWNQKWRAPLREALDGLRRVLDPLFEKESLEFFPDPWEARNNYIDVLLTGDTPGMSGKARSLLEMQRNAMLMYTSCGWFFDDISRIETVQILRYAARAVELAEDISGLRVEAPFLEALEKVPGNTPELKNAGAVYEKIRGRENKIPGA
ncbi:MAG: DUF3536 domain-containing protein [Candidatus Altiarchaeota archaeon]|nr:DUF3536 domain-containing protein [Candidatus Altiarchaeota archaeon]